jgi:hypothetical protein
LDLEDKSAKKSIFFVDPSRNNNFTTTYLPPRVVNDYYFERALITPKSKEFTVGVYNGRNCLRKVPLKITGKIFEPKKIESTTMSRGYSSTSSDLYNTGFYRKKSRIPLIYGQIQFLKIEEKVKKSEWLSLFVK